MSRNLAVTTVRRKAGRYQATAVAEFFDLAESCNASMGTSLPTFRVQRVDLVLKCQDVEEVQEVSTLW
jgi:hypothetical protein